jgi:1-acyl-sn-glycerol-3-phosphate acyltransferase
MMDIYRQGWWWALRGCYDDDRWVHGSLRVLRALESVGIELEVENLGVSARTEGPVVFIANHMSTLETFIVPCLIHPLKKITFIVKESLLSFPFFGRVIRARSPIAVGRKDPKNDLRVVLEEGTARLSSGLSVVVFPQTTRSEKFVPEKFNSIGIKLAKRAQVPVVPLALKTDAWAPGRLIKDFGPVDPKRKVHFAFGEPLAVKGNGREQHEEVIEFIRAKLEEWEQETG